MAGLYHFRMYVNGFGPGEVILRLEAWYDDTCGELAGEWTNENPFNPLMWNVWRLTKGNSALLPCAPASCPTATIIETPTDPEEPEPDPPPESDPPLPEAECQCCLQPVDPPDPQYLFFGDAADGTVDSDAEVALASAFESLIDEFPTGWCDSGEGVPIVDGQYVHSEPSDPPYDAHVRVAYDPLTQGTRVLSISYRVINTDTNTIVAQGEAFYSVTVDWAGCSDVGGVSLSLMPDLSYGDIWEWAETITLERNCDAD